MDMQFHKVISSADLYSNTKNRKNPYIRSGEKWQKDKKNYEWRFSNLFLENKYPLFVRIL